MSMLRHHNGRAVPCVGSKQQCGVMMDDGREEQGERRTTDIRHKQTAAVSFPAPAATASCCWWAGIVSL